MNDLCGYWAHGLICCYHLGHIGNSSVADCHGRSSEGCESEDGGELHLEGWLLMGIIYCKSIEDLLGEFEGYREERMRA